MQKQREFRAKDGAKIYLAAILSLLFFQILFSIIISALSIEQDSSTYYVLSYAAGVIFQLGYLAVFLVYLSASHSRPQIFINCKIKPVFFAVAVILPFVCFFFFFPASSAFDSFLDYINFPPMGITKPASAAQIVLLVLSAVVLAPVCEELIYRSALVSGLSQMHSCDFKGTLKLAALGAAAFSLMHMSPRQTVFQFFLGVGAIMLVLTSGSILPSIILHFINNSIAVLTYFVKPVETPFNFLERVLLATLAGKIVWSVVFALIGLAAFFGIWRFLKKHSTFVQVQVQTIEKKSFYTPFLLGLGICIAMWASMFLMI